MSTKRRRPATDNRSKQIQIESWANLSWDDLATWAGSRSVSRGRAYLRRMSESIINNDGDTALRAATECCGCGKKDIGEKWKVSPLPKEKAMKKVMVSIILPAFLLSLSHLAAGQTGPSLDEQLGDAAYNGDTAAVQQLLAQGANIEARDFNQPKTNIAIGTKRLDPSKGAPNQLGYPTRAFVAPAGRLLSPKRNL